MGGTIYTLNGGSSSSIRKRYKYIGVSCNFTDLNLYLVNGCLMNDRDFQKNVETRLDI